MSERAHGVKGWASVAIAVAGASAAGFSYLENVSTKRGAKQELAAHDVMAADMAKRLARIEGERATESKLCACVPKALPTPAAFTGPWAPEPDPGELDEPGEFRKPPRSDARVQRKLEEYDW